MEIQIERGIPIPPPYYRRGSARAEGACKCGCMPRPGLKTCDKCLAYVAAAYKKQRAAGLCAYGTCCKSPAQDGHTMCRRHHAYVGDRIRRLLEGRVASGLCRQCGKAPRVLGDSVYCVLCRQKNRASESPIPRKMRLIIRQFWRLDRIDQRRAAAEHAIQYLRDERMRQIISYRHGLTDGIDHTLEETGLLFKLTRERIRQIETRAYRLIEVNGVDTQQLRKPSDIQRPPVGQRPKRQRNRYQLRKLRAQRLAKEAINNGGLIRQPCERCGDSTKVYAHHHDYSKPLDVIWLCPRHHAEAHGKKIHVPKEKKIREAETQKKEYLIPCWLAKANPSSEHYNAPAIVDALAVLWVKRQQVHDITGLSQTTITKIINGRPINDASLLLMLRYIEALKQQQAA